MRTKGLFYSIKIKDRKRSETGILIAEGEDWILIKSLFIDYIMDGYKLINKRYIVSINRDEEDIFTEKVLRVNNRVDYDTRKIPLETKSLFKYLEKEQTVFDISTTSEDSIYIGKIQKLLVHSFYLKLLGTKGKWLDGSELFRMKSIRVISFDTDYIKSLLNFNKASSLT